MMHLLDLYLVQIGIFLKYRCCLFDQFAVASGFLDLYGFRVGLQFADGIWKLNGIVKYLSHLYDRTIKLNELCCDIERHTA